MPRYFFDTNNGHTPHRDDEGVELVDDEAARALAQATLPDMAHDTLPDGERRAFSVQVRRNGNVLYSACLTLAGEWHDGRAASAAEVAAGAAAAA